MTTISAYPLAWPFGWKRTPATGRRGAAFSRSTYEQAKAELGLA